ncbi:MAG TPA: gliding motility-associated C-terminal domain-containing protein [Bacteroidales bacterium]|nr:gliding motility-associated C-terminal domain-containing protein [Bacteroidales bacterium]
MKWFVIIFFCFFSIGIQAQDTIPPDIPRIDTVSVYDVNTGSVIISWLPCDSPDVAGYIIYRSINATWQIIANVPAPATSYIDNTAAGNFHPELYRLASYDHAGNYSPMTLANLYHNSIYVFPYQDSIDCHFAIRLNWNRYINWPEGVKEYQIFMSQDFGSWQLLDVVNGSSNQYYHMDVQDNTSYCYRIRAISNSGKTSTSNKTCFYTNLPNLPLYINADYATVENNSIHLSFTLDTDATICNYQLWRSKDGINYNSIANYNVCGQRNFEYTDNTANIEERYFYKLVSFDQCNNVRLESNIATNIVLKAQANEEVQNLLNWNAYQQWLAGVDSVYVYRIVEDAAPELILAQLAGSTSYFDDLTNIVMQNPSVTNKFCYYIELTENMGNPYMVKGRSKSNIACAYQFARVFIPNTFSPNGDEINDIFKPSTAFVDKEGYLFEVFDRWGNIIFKTNDPSLGWDGKSGGKFAPSGTYAYYLKYKTLDGNYREKAGTFNIFFP